MPLVPMRDGRSIRVRVVGDGAPVVMLAGLGMTSAHWLPFVLPLARRYRFIMPDWRGFGGSLDVAPRADDLFDDHAADLGDLVEAFGLRDFALVGYSLGASTSLHYHRDKGFDGVRRYLHIDQSPFVGRSADWSFGLAGERNPELGSVLRRARDLVDAHRAASHLSALEPAVRRELAQVLAGLGPILGAGRSIEPGLRGVFALPSPIARRLPLTDLAHLRLVLDAYGSAKHDYRESLRRCDTPITVFVGMRSSLYDPRGQMAIADYAKNARIVPFHESGHLAPFEEPRRFVRELGAFLDA